MSPIWKVPELLLGQAPDDARRHRKVRLSGAEPPVVTVLVVAALARPDDVVEIEAIAASR